MKGEEDKVKEKKKKWVNPLRDRTRVVPFIVPNEEERMCALGSLAGQKWRIKKSLQAIIPFFQPIAKPQPGQNLYENEEEGQGFGLFTTMYRNHINMETDIIYIATFYCKLSEQCITRVKKKARAFFHPAKVKLFKFDKKTDLTQFDPMKSQNGQKYYDGAKINFYFQKKLPKHCYSIAILTNLLIYNGNNPVEQLQEKWVFGLGSIKDRTSLISIEQICKKGYGRKIEGDYSDQQNVIFLEKVVNHQLCHTFGMRHCIYFTCLMNGTNHYEQAVRKVEHLCPICVRKLQHEIGFDFIERYEKLGGEKCEVLASKIRSAVEEK